MQQPDSVAAKALADAGVDFEQLAATLDQASTHDTADDTPTQAAARQLELSVTEDTVTVVLRDTGSVRLGKQIVRLNGGPIVAEGPQLDVLSRLWTAVNDWLTDVAKTLAPEPERAEGLLSRSRRRRRRAGGSS